MPKYEAYGTAENMASIAADLKLSNTDLVALAQVWATLALAEAVKGVQK